MADLKRGIALLVLVGCSKSAAPAPAGTVTPLGTTGATVSLPAGWHITGKGNAKQHLAWDLEHGDASAADWEIIWCRTSDEVTSAEALTALDDSCRNQTNIRPRVLASGGFFVECDKTELGTQLHHLGAAVAIKPVQTGGITADAAVHCFANSSAPSAAHTAILESLRAN